MLFSFSPEGAFILLLLELVLSGLAFVVLLWIQLREPREKSQWPIWVLSAGFALMTVAFAGRALYCRAAVYPPASAEPSHLSLLFAAEMVRLVSACCLVVGYLLMEGRRNWGAALAVGSAGLLAIAATRQAVDAQLSVQSITPFTTASAAEAAVLLSGVVLLGRWRRLLATAFLLLSLARLSAALGAWRPSATELAWAGEHVVTLIALIILTLGLERHSRQTTLRFFLRLNLVFVVLASSLILAIAEIGRRQFADFASLQSEDLAEFVRGHTLYYTRLGELPEEVLVHDDVIHKLVAEFGRYPDLRRVQVSLAGRTMQLSIDDDGDITQQVWTGDRPTPPRVSPADFSVTSLISVPIVLDGNPIGRVDLDQDLMRINERIGWQMQLVFVLFTISVGLACGVTGMLVTAADRTIRRQYAELERTLRRLSVAERLASIGAVTDGVAHEINNPAGIVVARSEYLRSVVEAEPLYTPIRDDVATISRQAQRIGKTVKDLLAFTRPGDVRPEPVAVHSVLDAALKLIEPMVLEKEIRLERRFLSAEATVSGDEARLEQVFINLLTNAVHATPPGGQITVSTSAAPDEGHLEIVVRDTGLGIRREHLDRIFDPFFTTKEPGRGTGLGLSIAHSITRSHGGTIDVSSTAGAGSEFRVRLPLYGLPQGITPAAPRGPLEER